MKQKTNRLGSQQLHCLGHTCHDYIRAVIAAHCIYGDYPEREASRSLDAPHHIPPIRTTAFRPGSAGAGTPLSLLGT
jgi:hypothetical protein